jgi:hypothetical protein
MNGKVAGVLFTALVLSAHVSWGAPARPGSAPRASLGVIFERALQRATEKLDAPACRLVLDDFQDASGRTLAEKLSETGLSAPEFPTQLEFRDGRNEDLCRRGHVDAFTSVGGSTVWACPGGSLWLGGYNNRAGANTLIHEMLHALGLEENPPSSIEITQRVGERCGL